MGEGSSPDDASIKGSASPPRQQESADAPAHSSPSCVGDQTFRFCSTAPRKPDFDNEEEWERFFAAYRAGGWANWDAGPSVAWEGLETSHTVEPAQKYVYDLEGHLVEPREFYRRHGYLPPPSVPTDQRMAREYTGIRHSCFTPRRNFKRNTADRYARHAKAVFKVAAATVTVACAQTTEPKILFLGQAGWLAEQVVRASQALCSHAMLRPRTVVCIPDLDADWRTAGLQATDSRGERVRFYASAPLLLSTPDADGPAGQSVCGGLSQVELGRLTILGTKPRSDFDADDARLLQDIAAMVSEALEHERKVSQVERMKKNQVAIAQLARQTADDADGMDQDDLQEDQEMLGDQHFTSLATNRSGHVRPRRLQKVANLILSTMDASTVYAVDVTAARITSHRRSSTLWEGRHASRQVSESPQSAGWAAYPQTPWLNSSSPNGGPGSPPVTPSTAEHRTHSLFPDVNSRPAAADIDSAVAQATGLSPISPSTFSTRRPTLRHQATASSSVSGSGLGSGFVPPNGSPMTNRRSWTGKTAHRVSHASQSSDASSGSYSATTSVDSGEQDFTCSMTPDRTFQLLAFSGRQEGLREIDIRSHDAQNALCAYMASRRERSDLDIDMHFGAVPLHDDILYPNQEALYSDALEPLWATSGKQPATALSMLVFDHERQPTYLLLVGFDEMRLIDAGDWGFGRACTALLYACVLRDSARMASRQELQFVRRVQHELRTPLHAILGITDFLRGVATHTADESSNESIDPEMLSELLQAIRLAGTNLSSILDDVLDLGEVSGLKPDSNAKKTSTAKEASNNNTNTPDTRTEEVNLRSEIEEAVENELQLVEMSNRQNTQMDENVSGKVLPVVILDIAESIDRRWRIDRSRTLKVVRKLVNNAVRFNKSDGGLVDIVIAPRRAAAARGQQNERAQKIDASGDSSEKATSDEEVMIDFRIEDNGVGMTSTFCAHELVRPFSKRDGFSQGMGLGFTISSALTSQIGGYIDVKSKLGSGTIVTATLPLLPIPSADTAPAAAVPYCVSKVWFDGFVGRALERAQDFIFARLRKGGLQLASHKEDAGLWILSEAASQAFCSLHAGAARERKARVAVLAFSPTAPTNFTEHLRTLQVPVAVMRAPLCITLLDRLEVFLRDKAPTIIRAPQPHLPLHEHAEAAEASVIPSATLHSTDAPITSSPTSTAPDAQARHSPPDDAAAGSGSSPMPATPKATKTAAGDNTISSPPGSVTFLEAARENSFARPSPAGGGDKSAPAAFRVLLVEDNSVNMKLLTTIVKRLGFPYEEAHDGIEAVERFITFEPSLVLLDMSMPRMDGFEAALHMRARDVQPRPRIVAVTALSSPADRARGLECGCDEWRTKPLSIRALKTDLERWCADHRAEVSATAIEPAADKGDRQSVAA